MNFLEGTSPPPRFSFHLHFLSNTTPQPETIPRTVDVEVAMTLRDMIQNGARDTNADNNPRDSHRDVTPPPLATASNNMSNGTPAHINGRGHGHSSNHDDHWGTDSERSGIMEDEV
jgi:hypothetical protein